MSGVEVKSIWWEGFIWKRYVLSFEWKRVGVMDSDESDGDDGRDAFMAVETCIDAVCECEIVNP